MASNDNTSNYPQRSPFKRKPYKRRVKVNGRNGRLIKMGAFWGRKDKNGKVYLSGRLGQNTVMVFQNDYKEKDTQPDYFLYLITDPLEEDLQEILGSERSPKSVTNPLPPDKVTDPYSMPRYLVIEDTPTDDSPFFEDDDE